MGMGRIQLKPYVAFYQKLLLEGVLMKRHINEDPAFKIWYIRTKFIVRATLYGIIFALIQ